MKNNIIYFTEKNIHGAIVIAGALGIRQYYYYTVTQAKKLYTEEFKKKVFING